ncbi:MAG: hypothetical protein JW932_09445 [Deltaproteobacteria bacterium]|nr:hypothetical protein [Deltaproteobacteria bacterium]
MAKYIEHRTMMGEDIMIEVSGCRVNRVPGTLRGYPRHSVKGVPHIPP